MILSGYPLMNESKNYGVLYHNTTIYRLYSILKSNRMNKHITSADNKKLSGVCFTRSKYFDCYQKQDTKTGRLEYKTPILRLDRVRITFDGDKLSDTYKMAPFNGSSDTELKYRKLNGSKLPPHREQEERLFSDLIGDNNKRGIKNYIKLVTFSGKLKDKKYRELIDLQLSHQNNIHLEEVFELLKNEGIKYDFDNIEKP